MSQAASSKHAFPPGVKVPAQEAASAVPFQTAIGTQRPPSTSSQQPSAPQQRVPSTLSDLVTSMEEVKKKGSTASTLRKPACSLLDGSAAHRMANLDQVNKMLDSGRTSAPQPQDTNRSGVGAL
jgi:CCR4-NOT transcription complex subunit 3